MPYILPADINPIDRVYACVPIPDDPMHRAAFMGQIAALSRWYSWERDDAHTGKEVAAVWRDIIDDELSITPNPCFQTDLCASWYWLRANIPGHSSSSGSRLIPMTVDADCGGLRQVGYVFGADRFPSLQANLTGLAYDSVDGTFVGGVIKELQLLQTDLVSSPSGTIYWADCLGTEHSEAFSGNQRILFNIEAQWFHCQANFSFCGSLVLGDKACVLA